MKSLFLITNPTSEWIKPKYLVIISKNYGFYKQQIFILYWMKHPILSSFSHFIWITCTGLSQASFTFRLLFLVFVYFISNLRAKEISNWNFQIFLSLPFKMETFTFVKDLHFYNGLSELPYRVLSCGVLAVTNSATLVSVFMQIKSHFT